MTASLSNRDFTTKAARDELNEEVAFFRDICGWSETRIETHLGLAAGTLAQRRHREARKAKASNN